MSTYAYDNEPDYLDYDEDDDSDQDDDGVLAVRLAQLEQENARLRRQLGTDPPPKPVADIASAIASANTPQEVEAIIAAHNAAAATPAPPPEPADTPELKAAIAAASSPDEVMSLLAGAGFRTSLNPIED